MVSGRRGAGFLVITTRLDRVRPEYGRFDRLKLSVEAELDVGRVVAQYALSQLGSDRMHVAWIPAEPRRVFGSYR